MLKRSYIIIFDGQCNLCNVFVNFIIKRDPLALFSFTPMQEGFAFTLMSEYHLNVPDIDSVVLIKDDRCYLESGAIFEILKDLQGGWSLLRIFRFFPASLNNFLYRCIAKNRYRIFGKTHHCVTPSAEIRSRFIMDTD